MHSDDARNVLKVLAGGFVNVKLTADNTDTYVTEISKLVGDAGIGLAVAVEWVESRLSFPTVAEFVDECGKEWERRKRRARAIEQGQAHRQPGMFACRTCEDRRVVEVDSLEGGMTVTPCPDCDPELAAYWRDGHYDPSHSVSLCDHARCRQRQREIEAKVRNRGDARDDGAQRSEPQTAAAALGQLRERLAAVRTPYADD